MAPVKFSTPLEFNAINAEYETRFLPSSKKKKKKKKLTITSTENHVNTILSQFCKNYCEWSSNRKGEV